MKVIEYFTSADRAHWLEQIGQSEWDAGQYLASLLREDRLKETVGETALVLLLTNGSELVSFCTLAPLDDVQPTTLGPWIGFVYTFPAYRGHRRTGLLLEHAESLAAIMGREAVYISTGHTGLYEKYGYVFERMDTDVSGGETRIYRKALRAEGAEKERREAMGGELKGRIVAAARQGIDPVAVCGFSCDHCFLGQWCGGCRSCFNCCSFGTLFDKGKCPNIVCAKKRGVEGCFACEALEGCRIGFYADGNDGANACKAQALFIRRHGKKTFLRVQDELHRLNDFKKTQEILSEDVGEAIDLLEETAARMTGAAQKTEGEMK